MIVADAIHVCSFTQESSAPSFPRELVCSVNGVELVVPRQSAKPERDVKLSITMAK